MTRKAICCQSLVLVFALILGVLGCQNNSGPVRYDLSGSVTYDGKPVPVGTVIFTPDSSRNNDGPGATADIRNGRYQTLPGDGTIGGPHTVSIIGYDGKPIGSGNTTDPAGSRLFATYTTQVDLPHTASTQDFAVPAGAAIPSTN